MVEGGTRLACKTARFPKRFISHTHLEKGLRERLVGRGPVQKKTLKVIGGTLCLSHSNQNFIYWGTRLATAGFLVIAMHCSIELNSC